MIILLTIISGILSLIWIIWSLLPALPWPQLNFIALLILEILPGTQFGRKTLTIRWIIVVFITIIDYIIPILGTKKLWGTKRWTRWSTIWLIIAVIILPIAWITIWPFGLIGLLLWPFLGAYIGETLWWKQHRHALKSAIGTFIWFLTGTLLKLILSIVMTGVFIYKIIEIIKLSL